jgi:WD40 repeat protein
VDSLPPRSAGASVNSLAFSRDSRYLSAATSAKSAPVWTLSGRLVASLPHPADVTGLAFTDADRRLLSTDGAGTTTIWEFPAPVSHTFGTAVSAVSYSATAPRLAVTLRSGRTDEWDVVDEWRPAPVGSWYAAAPSSAPSDAWWLRQPALTTTGTATAAGTGTTVSPATIASALAGTRRLTTVTASLLSPNGQLLVAAGSNHLVYLWKLDGVGGPQLVDTLTGPRTAITRIALSPDYRTLAVATAAGHVWLWSVDNPQKASLSTSLTAARGDLRALAFSPSDNTLVAGGDNRRLTFWHYRPYQAVNRICALSGTPITPSEWQLWVPGAAYRPPCASWTPPAPPSSP